MRFERKKLEGSKDTEEVFVKEVKNKVVMTKFDKPLYNISKYKKVKGGKIVKKFKNGKTTKPIKRKKDVTNRGYRSITSVKKSLTMLKDLVEINFGGYENEFLVTLKFDKPLLWYQAKREAISFFRQLNKEYVSAKIMYICKFEPNAFVGWHMHAIVRFEGMQTFTESNLKIILEKVWGLGEVYVSALKSNVEGISSYLGDIQKPNKEYFDYKKNLEKKLVSEDKRYSRQKKYEQAKKYPKGSRVYIVSQGLEKAVKSQVNGEAYKQMVKRKRLKSAYSVNIVSEDGEIVNGITKTIHK